MSPSFLQLQGEYAERVNQQQQQQLRILDSTYIKIPYVGQLCNLLLKAIDYVFMCFMVSTFLKLVSIDQPRLR